ncbi:MAG TPA: glycosyltransferase family 4 protein [Candidatus Binatia bacterium]|jgi:glycosyltransferase involved in cell wall biosynthesis|nr:glycosyltransferase family 4 protein [Candidatus Binatia bacterium]
MRFLMLNWRDPKNPKAGGAERVTQAYLSELRRRGHDVYWFANEFAGAQRQEPIDEMTVVRGGGQGSSILRAIEWYRRQEPFDLVIDQHHGIPWFAPWWCRTNCIAYIHEVLGPIWDAFYSWPLSTIGRWQERWTHWLYRRIPFWTPSESTRRTLEAHRVRKVTVIPNGTDTLPLAELESKPLLQPVRLVVASRLAPNKRVDHAVAAVRILLERGIEAHLVVVGTGEMQAQLEQQVQQTGLSAHVTFSGRLGEEEKNAQLRGAHFLVHPSMREGWGLNVIEANAMGTPAVVYPVDGLVDSTLDGQTGIVTRTESPAALAEGLLGILKTPETYERLRVNAWTRSKTLQWQKVLPAACDWLEAQAIKPRTGKP